MSVRTISFSGQAVLVLGITGISELRRTQETLEHCAAFDELTGLLNRGTGMMMLGKSMSRLRREGGQLAVCFVDLDEGSRLLGRADSRMYRAKQENKRLRSAS